jgi:hypothetical protein
MGARKNINVTGANKDTDALTAGADVTVTGFKIMSASTGGTAKTNYTTLATSRTISAGGKLNVADAGIYVTLGTTGAAVAGQIGDAILQAMLDAQFAAGDYIAWFSDSSTEVISRLARTAVDAWDSAITF